MDIRIEPIEHKRHAEVAALLTDAFVGEENFARLFESERPHYHERAASSFAHGCRTVEVFCARTLVARGGGQLLAAATFLEPRHFEPPDWIDRCWLRVANWRCTLRVGRRAAKRFRAYNAACPPATQYAPSLHCS